ncbi:MAG TPA: efflux RND transporter periplasmic adaptor subunit [Caulobacterales bacterium]|nr:efflux RND transporter periplasmic adaptor subunit [Caulobacterales bacterium]
MADTVTRAPAHSEAAAPPKRSQRQRLLTILAVVVVLGAIGYGAYWGLYASHFESTDNAYVGADTAEITPLVSAPVAQVLVRETQTVTAGQVLIELDPADAQLAVTEAQADLARANADLSRARVDLARRRALAPGGAVSADELSTAENAYNTAVAARAAAQSRVQAAQLTLSRMTIRAPIAGVVSNKNVQVGQRVEAGTPLMVIAPIGNAYVDANFKEGQLRHVQVGQPVTLVSDLYGDSVVYHGTIAGFSGGTGSAFSLIPAQNASGNWIKVVQRVPVRIHLDPREVAAHPLRVGMSMRARVDISGAR